MTTRELQQAFSKSAFTPEHQRKAIAAMLEASPPQLRIEGDGKVKMLVLSEVSPTL